MVPFCRRNFCLRVPMENESELQVCVTASLATRHYLYDNRTHLRLYSFNLLYSSKTVRCKYASMTCVHQDLFNWTAGKVRVLILHLPNGAPAIFFPRVRMPLDQYFSLECCSRRKIILSKSCIFLLFAIRSYIHVDTCLVDIEELYDIFHMKIIFHWICHQLFMYSPNL